MPQALNVRAGQAVDGCERDAAQGDFFVWAELSTQAAHLINPPSESLRRCLSPMGAAQRSGWHLPRHRKIASKPPESAPADPTARSPARETAVSSIAAARGAAINSFMSMGNHSLQKQDGKRWTLDYAAGSSAAGARTSGSDGSACSSPAAAARQC